MLCPMDSLLIHLIRHSSIVTTERFYIDHDLDSRSQQNSSTLFARPSEPALADFNPLPSR